MRISDWSSDVCSSDLLGRLLPYLVSTRQCFQQLRSAVPAFALWQRYMSLGAVRVPAPSPAAAETDRAALHIERMQLAPPLAGIDVRPLCLRPGELTLVGGDSSEARRVGNQ